MGRFIMVYQWPLGPSAPSVAPASKSTFSPRRFASQIFHFVEDVQDAWLLD
jgi:hypothetical protein